jgi:hypothetical protein
VAASGITWYHHLVLALPAVLLAATEQLPSSSRRVAHVALLSIQLARIADALVLGAGGALSVLGQSAALAIAARTAWRYGLREVVTQRAAPRGGTAPTERPASSVETAVPRRDTT